MKIIDIEMTTVEIPVIRIEEGGIAPYLGSQDKVGTSKATSVIYKVITDEGIVGWGEMNPIITLNFSRVLLEEYIKPKLVGKNPFHINKMMQDFSPVYNPQVNTKSFLTGVEMACWDIMGKALDLPVYELLGGKVRDKVEIAYALGMLDHQATQEKIRQIKAEGFSTLKTKGGKDLHFDIERAEAMREAAGRNFSIRVDMNQGYDTPVALRYLKAVEHLDLQYVEQPIKANKLDDLKRLRDSTKTPIGINEDCYIPNNVMEAIKRGCIDVAVADMEPIGGISEMVRLAHVAEQADLPLAHHCAWDMGIKLAAILQSTCTLPAFSYPMDSTYQAHGADVLAETIKIENGCYVIPEGPGLGIDVDEEKIRSFSITYSPRLFV